MAKNTSSQTSYVEVGLPAPAFELKDQDSRTHRLKDYRGRWLVLYFYPKDNTSGCTVEACKFRDAIATIKKLGAEVLGVSPDDQKSHHKFATKFSLPFSLLADTEKLTSNAYGVWQEKSMYGRKYMGVARTTYLIDPQGKIAHCWEKVKTAQHDQEVLDKLRELQKS